MRILGLMEGVDLPTRPIGRVWLRGLHVKHLYLGISGVYGDTSDISIHGLAPFYQIPFISLVNHHSPTIATPVFFSQPKSSHALTRCETTRVSYSVF
ncbi:hypothetical protein PIB30_095322 [Stylosanthes scabra]|uniref:Uncharacterized protein n=1 Tax=Stylosanthes scabra TaxID=79078 RepID=A0ABU6YTG0_9FABA|nr:hypothetical protein [Stylosanthes scabra]